ncbi:S1 family peptidase [Lentzea alba]|uniref:hypothetical protein n=1 Tax=Lentzea alba TaxID=2714351 RepID=UPI0039C000AF
MASLLAVPQAVAEPGGPVTSDAGYLASAIKELTIDGEFADAVTRIRVDEKGRLVTVHAPDTDLAAKAVEAAKAKSGKDVGVDFHKSKYRLSELEAARDKVVSEAKSFEAGGVELTGVSIDADGNGITLKVNDLVKAKQSVAMSSSIGAVSSADVEFVQRARLKALSRDFDTPPYAGGISLRPGGDNRHWCTSGFGIRQGTSEFLITADHCFNVGKDIYQGGGVLVGHVVSEHTLYDMESIRTDTWSGVYTFNDQWKNYRNSEWSLNGMNVCQSGYYTNQACDYVVVEELASWLDNTGNWRYGVQVCRTSGLAGGIGGDSGGPVYSFRADGYLDSRGIVSAEGDAPHCMHFTETKQLLRAWNVELLTS